MNEKMHAGTELIERGWRQGSLLAARSLLSAFAEPASPAAEYIAGLLKPEEYVVLASNDCDIAANAGHERKVEALRAYLTTDKTEIFNAGRNSIRRFLLRRQTRPDGTEEGLVADATTRIPIDKTLLLDLSPEAAFGPGDVVSGRVYPQWLGARYNRPAVDDRIVKAVHRPIVEAVARLSEGDNYRRVLVGIGQIRYRIRNDSAPYEVELLLMRSEGTSEAVDYRDAHSVAGWLANVLQSFGQAQVVDWDIRDLWSISAGDLLQTVELPLSHYSLAESTVVSEVANGSER